MGEKLTGAKIVRKIRRGCRSFVNLTLNGSFWLTAEIIEGEDCLKLRNLKLTGAGSLYMANAIIKSSVDLSGATIEGNLVLINVQIEGTLDLTGAKIRGRIIQNGAKIKGGIIQ